MSAVTEAEHYDLAIIGAGPGGYVAAIRAAQLGMRVVCVDREAALGGTCLRIGCIPSKALLDSSELLWQARTRLATHGVSVGEVSLDLPTMMRRKDHVVQGLTTGVAGLFKKNRITRRHGSARIATPDRVAIEGPDAGTVLAARILIATGSGPATLPGFELDGTRIVSSEEALSFDAVPGPERGLHAHLCRHVDGLPGQLALDPGAEGLAGDVRGDEGAVRPDGVAGRRRRAVPRWACGVAAT